MAEDESDQLLVQRFQQGDNTAFDLLVLKYQHKVTALISRYVRDFSEAQDVSQDAFIRAFRALPRFRGEAQFYTWLYRIAVNTAKNHLVAQGRRPPTDDIDAADAVQFAAGERLRETSTPELELLRDEIERAVAAAVDALPEELRVAVTLREVEGMSYEQIAERMGCPIGTVRSRIFRAREAIDDTIKPLLGGDRVRP